jgi:acetylornithine deacetylase/succinyl-diaminopimelate desuccinylase-like protein
MTIAGTQEEVLRLTREWVGIDSVLPHEDKLAQAVAAELATLGVTPQWQEVSPGRRNVYASVTLGPKPVLVTLTGHLDTVGVADGWKTNPFEAVQQGNQLFGLGALDMKSGVAAALVAFKTLLEDRSAHRRLGKIAFAATVDEEAFGTGSRALLSTELGKSDLILLTEPFHGTSVEDRVPLAGTGKVLYRIIVQGKSSHAQLGPEEGINAVDDAARIVQALDRLPLGSHPVLGKANYCTLKIDGGYREYAVVVPERCEIIVTRSLVPGETKDLAVRQLETLIGSLGLRSTVRVETAPPFYEPYEVASDGPAATAFREAYRQVMGREPITGGLVGITDANVYAAEGGIPTITFGATGQGFHQAQEHVDITTFGPVVQVLVETTLRFSER